MVRLTARAGLREHRAMNSPLRPLRDRIIVRPLDVVMSTIIVTLGDRKPRRGVVVAVGPGRRDRHGNSWPWGTKVGDVIQFADVLTYPAYRVPRDGAPDEVFLILSEADVCGVEEPAGNANYGAVPVQLGPICVTIPSAA